MYCLYCVTVLICNTQHSTQKSILLSQEILTQYKNYFVKLRAFTKCKLCCVKIFPNKECNFT